MWRKEMVMMKSLLTTSVGWKREESVLVVSPPSSLLSLFSLHPLFFPLWKEKLLTRREWLSLGKKKKDDANNMQKHTYCTDAIISFRRTWKTKRERERERKRHVTSLQSWNRKTKMEDLEEKGNELYMLRREKSLRKKRRSRVNGDYDCNQRKRTVIPVITGCRSCSLWSILFPLLIHSSPSWFLLTFESESQKFLFFHLHHQQSLGEERKRAKDWSILFFFFDGKDRSRDLIFPCFTFALRTRKSGGGERNWEREKRKR